MADSVGSRDHVAIIGMSCRFPGASDLDEFWANLCDARDTITRYPKRTAAAEGGRAGEGYVPAHGILHRSEWFDAGFFRISPREAGLLSPQHRVFLECAAEALENAACDPDRFDGSIGVYAGGAETGYGNIVRSQRHRLGPVSDWEILFGTAPEYMAARVAYKLNLRGPSIAIQAACATSLVAVHMAAQGLRAGDCDMALAGAASVHVPAKLSTYAPGGVISKNGSCRTFDASADGIVGSDGVGIVVLKRLETALRDGDFIYAVLRGSAVNNDGAGRIGFTAPSVQGQARVVRDATRAAGVDTTSISYVEAHGTGTPLGDPIELAALSQIYRETTDAVGRCGIGSVKTNVGHTDVAAGAAGLIKTSLALRSRKIPPSLHFECANSEIDFERSPFRVVKQLEDWSSDTVPRRAGVSSFGIGGTNAHLVLEEAPHWSATPGRPWHILVLSAEQPESLEAACARLSHYLNDNPSHDLADTAWTLQVGRREMRFRRCALVHHRADAAAALENHAMPSALEPVSTSRPAVAFRFGANAETDEIDRLLGYDPSLRDLVDIDDLASRSRAGRSVLAAYLAARSLERWGVEPRLVVGEGAGVWTAAAFAGLLDLAQAIKIVEARGISNSAYDAAIDELPAPKQVRVAMFSAALGGTLQPGERLAADQWRTYCASEPGFPSDEATYRWIEIARDIEPTTLQASDEQPPRALRHLAELWQSGLSVAWREVHGPGSRHRVPLPTYVFQRSRYLIEGDEPDAGRADTRAVTEAADGERIAPHDTEAKISDLFAEALKHPAVAIDDDFFELGGDSMIAAALFERINESFRIELDPWTIYEAQTPRQLGELVRHSLAEASA